jgi:hypothetical protein
MTPIEKPKMTFTPTLKYSLVDAVLFVALLAFKLSGFAIPWWLVLMPFWGPAFVALLLLGIYLAAVQMFEATVSTNAKIAAQEPSPEEAELEYRQAFLRLPVTGSSDVSDAPVDTGPSSSLFVLNVAAAQTDSDPSVSHA